MVRFGRPDWVRKHAWNYSPCCYALAGRLISLQPRSRSALKTQSRWTSSTSVESLISMGLMFKAYYCGYFQISSRIYSDRNNVHMGWRALTTQGLPEGDSDMWRYVMPIETLAQNAQMAGRPEITFTVLIDCCVAARWTERNNFKRMTKARCCSGSNNCRWCLVRSAGCAGHLRLGTPHGAVNYRFDHHSLFSSR